MAKLFINKDIVADTEKMENWYLTGVDGISFSDIQAFIGWIDRATTISTSNFIHVVETSWRGMRYMMR